MKITQSLSPNHPLRTDPNMRWPYTVVVGYRQAGSRRIVKTKTIHVLARGHESARSSAMRIAREIFTPIQKDGERVIASRVVSSRADDLADRVNLASFN